MKLSNGYPKVNITKFAFDESVYQYNDMKWDAPTLVEFAKKQNYKVFDMPLACVDLAKQPWKLNNFGDIIYHMQRTKDVDLKYPILLDDDGIICDGWHRVAKALIEGKTSIRAIRLEKMPHVSGYSTITE